MIKCPNCNELIGEDINECPFCKHAVTEEERKKAHEEAELIHEEAVEASCDEYRKRSRNEFILVGIIIVTSALCTVITNATGLGAVGVVIMFVLLIAILIIGVLKFRVGCCPYCESYIGGGNLFVTHCPKCGGRLR